MARKVKKSAPKRRRIEFSIEMPAAQQVILMGDFNRWDPKTHPMRKIVIRFGRLRPGRSMIGALAVQITRNCSARQVS